MADIAILVAEEYDRMVRHAAAEKASPAVMGHRKIYPETEKKIVMMCQVYEKKIEDFKRSFEAKSQFALAASFGFFSA